MAAFCRTESGGSSAWIDVRRAELAQRRRDIDESIAELAEVERRRREDMPRLG